MELRSSLLLWASCGSRAEREQANVELMAGLWLGFEAQSSSTSSYGVAGVRSREKMSWWEVHREKKREMRGRASEVLEGNERERKV